MAKKLLVGSLGFLVGLLVAAVLVVSVEAFSSVVHPFPPGVMELEGEAQHAAICEHVGKYPDWVLGVIVPMYGVTACIAVWLATRIGGRIPGALLGMLLFSLLVCNVWLMGLPYPLWFKIIVTGVVPLGLFAGLLLIPSRKSSTMETPVKS